MYVAELNAILSADVAGFQRNLASADASLDNTSRLIGQLEGIAASAGHAMEQVKVSAAQAVESERALQTIRNSVSDVSNAAIVASDRLAQVKLEAVQAAETAAVADSMGDSLDKLTAKAVVAGAALSGVGGAAGAGGAAAGAGGGSGLLGDAGLAALLGFGGSRGIRLGIPGVAGGGFGRFGGGLRIGTGMAAFGSLAGLAGFGAERAVTSTLGIGGSMVGGLLGGGLLAGGALGVAATGMGTDMAGIGQAAGDTKMVTTDLGALNDAISEYGKRSTEAASAQAKLNADLGSFSPLAKNAVLAASQTAVGFHQLFNAATGAAESTGAEILNQAMHVGESFLPTIGKFAAQNMGIIQADIQPFFSWLQNAGPAGGLGVFTNLEQIFQHNLPTSIAALTQGFELFVKTIDVAAQHTGGFMQSLDNLFTKANSTAGFASWSNEVNKLIGLFETWMHLFGSLTGMIYDLFKPAVGFGEQFAAGLTNIINLVRQWLNAAGTQDVLHTLFAAHLSQIQAMFSVLKSLLPLLESTASAFLQIEAAIASVVAGPLRVLADLIGQITQFDWVDKILGWVAALYLARAAITAVLTALKLIAPAAAEGAAAGVAEMDTIGAAAATSAGAVDGLAASLAALGGAVAIPFAAAAAATVLMKGAPVPQSQDYGQGAARSAQYGGAMGVGQAMSYGAINTGGDASTRDPMRGAQAAAVANAHTVMANAHAAAATKAASFARQFGTPAALPTGIGGGGGGGEGGAAPTGISILPAGLAAALTTANTNTPTAAGQAWKLDAQALNDLNAKLKDHNTTAKETLDIHKEIGTVTKQEADAYKVLAKASTDAVNAQTAAGERGILGLGAPGGNTTATILSLRSQATQLGQTISTDAAQGIDVAAVTAQLDKIQKVLKNNFVPPDVRQAIADQFSTIKQTLTSELSDALSAAQTAVSAVQQQVSQAFTQISNSADQAFQQNVAQHVSQMQVLVNSPLGQFLFGGTITMTPAGQQLQALQQAQTLQQLQQNLTDAQTAVAQATSAGTVFDAATGIYSALPGDSTALVSAQQQLADAQVAIQENTLQQQDAIESAAATSQLTAAQSAYQAQQNVVQSAMDQQTAAIEAGMESGAITGQNGWSKIKTIWTNAGVDLNTLSFAIGGNIYSGLSDGLKPVFTLLTTLGTDLQTVATLTGTTLPGVNPFGLASPAGGIAGAIASGATNLSSLIPGFASGGVVKARPGGTLVRVGEGGQDEAIGPVGGGGGDLHVHIHAGTIVGDPQEFAHAILPSVRSELLKFGRRNGNSIFGGLA